MKNQRIAKIIKQASNNIDLGFGTPERNMVGIFDQSFI